MPGPYCYDYPRPSVTVDLVAFRWRDGLLQTLLIQRGRDPFVGRWAFPGGFLDMDETAETAARREFLEETSIESPATLSFLGVFDAPDRDPRGRTISLAYLGLFSPDSPEPQGADDAARASWVDIPTLDASTLAFDHHALLESALRWLGTSARQDSRLLDLLDSPFHRLDVQALFQAIHGPNPDADVWLDHLRQTGRITPLDDGRFHRRLESF